MALLALRQFILLAVSGLALSACSTLALFDTFAPKDAGGVLAERDIAYGSGERQKLNVYTPRDGADGAPVLMFIYGGSWKEGDKDLYDFAGRAFAAQGFVTVIADYRLVPQVRFPAFVEDGAAAVAWIEDNIGQYGGDPERFYLAGHSAGAYNAVMLAVDPQWLEAAGVSDGLIDAVAGLAGPYDFYPWDTDVSRAAFQGASDPANTTQPVALITADAPALLLMTGLDDTTVKPRNVDALAARARDLGVPVTVKKYDGIDHVGIAGAISRPFRDEAPVLEDIVTFFNSVEG
ncbi:carboxylesterase [Aquisalinus flavus]|uniref:Carboxylesterase n=2 Tax=Aquisalinus flavus TaxID=1526572 RepID=A0A8J2V1W0_9PROT|nr:alpha/beta hydrolase [Aquisalinus flavus]GGC95264.1 carboxylesterase [Aquisalinus flavus]